MKLGNIIVIDDRCRPRHEARHSVGRGRQSVDVMISPDVLGGP